MDSRVQPGETQGDLSAPITRKVVDDEKFPILVRLVQATLDGFGQKSFAVVDGENDGNLGSHTSYRRRDTQRTFERHVNRIGPERAKV
jgi:hypothetical protein